MGSAAAGIDLLNDNKDQIAATQQMWTYTRGESNTPVRPGRLHLCCHDMAQRAFWMTSANVISLVLHYLQIRSGLTRKRFAWTQWKCDVLNTLIYLGGTVFFKKLVLNVCDGTQECLDKTELQPSTGACVWERESNIIISPRIGLLLMMAAICTCRIHQPIFSCKNKLFSFSLR